MGLAFSRPGRAGARRSRREGARTDRARVSSKHHAIRRSGLRPRRPFDERHFVVEALGLPRLQSRPREIFLWGAAKPALGEQRHAARQAHLVGAAEVEAVVTEFQKITVYLRAANDRDRARTTSERRAGFLERGAGGVPEPSVGVGLGGRPAP